VTIDQTNRDYLAEMERYAGIAEGILEVHRLTRAGVAARLQEWERETGVSSVEFYERYCCGEFDSPDGMERATYVEVYAHMVVKAEAAAE
jgi:hypothetical protein